MPTRNMSAESSLWQHSAGEVLQAAGARRSVPTGGSVTALSGAFAVSLLILSVNLTLTKAEPPERLTAFGDDLRSLQERLQHLTDADAELFAAFMKQARSAAERASGEDEKSGEDLRQQTRELPLQLARELALGLMLAQQLRPLVHRSVVSDIEAGAALLQGALRATLLTLAHNLHTAEADAAEPFWAEWQTLKAEEEAAEGWLQKRLSSSKLIFRLTERSE